MARTEHRLIASREDENTRALLVRFDGVDEVVDHCQRKNVTLTWIVQCDTTNLSVLAQRSVDETCARRSMPMQRWPWNGEKSFEQHDLDLKGSKKRLFDMVQQDRARFTQRDTRSVFFAKRME